MDWILEAALRALTYAAPIGIAALGELVVERAGMVNLGVEGMMALGAAVAALVAIATGNPYAGLAAATLAGLALAGLFRLLLLAGADQIVVGLALVFLGVGLGEVAGAYVDRPAPQLPQLSHGLGVLELAFPLAALALHALLYRTWTGYALRSVGENPEAARALGVRVERVRTYAAALGGALAGLAGGYLVLYMFQGKWFSGVTMGWGWIAIGTVILGYWHPLLVAVAAYLVAAMFVLEPVLVEYGVPVAAAHAAPYLAVVAALVAVTLLARRRGLKPPTQVWVEMLA